MDNLTGSVHLGTNNCLICNQNVENSLLIKKEIEENCDDHVQTDPGQNYNSEGYLLHPKANTEEPARTNKVGPSLSTPEVQDHLNFVNTLCKLLKLTSSVTTRLRRSKVCQLNPKLFCYDCSLIMSDAIKLFEQIEVLQNNVQKIVHESYLNHVNDVLVGHVNDGCKKRKTCSKIDRLREIIVNDVQAQVSCKEQLISTTKYLSVSGGHEDLKINTSNNKYMENVELKDLSVTLYRLTNDEINEYSSNLPNLKDEIPVSLDDEDDPGYEFHSNEIDDGGFQQEENEDYLPTSTSSAASSPMSYESDKSYVEDVPVPRPSPKKKLVKRKSNTQQRNIGKKKVDCPECQQSFNTQYLMNIHLAKFHEVDLKARFPFNCSQCGKIYSAEDQLKGHLERQGGTCKHSKLPEHCTVVSGKGDKKFQCTICGYRARKKGRFESHLHKHTKVKNFMCDICGIPLSRREAIGPHKLVMHYEGNVEDHPFKCKFPGCDRYFGTLVALTNHEKKLHGHGPLFPCSLCDFKGVASKHLSAHRKLIHPKSKFYKCEVCNKAYKVNDALKKHNLQHHTAPEDRPFKCTICGKGFVNSYRLNNHSAVHTNNKPIMCEICGKTFAVKVYLGIHMKIHEKKGEVSLLQNMEMVD